MIPNLSQIIVKELSMNMDYLQMVNDSVKSNWFRLPTSFKDHICKKYDIPDEKIDSLQEEIIFMLYPDTRPVVSKHSKKTRQKSIDIPVAKFTK